MHSATHTASVGTVQSLSVADAIQARRAVKAFDASHNISEQEIERLLSLAVLAPTAFNIQNWRFLLLRDPALRKQVRALAWDQAQVTDASLLIVLCADLKAWEKEPARYWRHVQKPVQDFMLPAISQYYSGREQVQRDEAMRSCGIAAMALMLAAKEMGYDSCPMDGFDFDAVAKRINLPSDHAIAMFIAIGKGIKEPFPRGGQLPLSEVVVEDRFA
ncbi:MAG TPA: nitroreductase family protein [Acidiferrobacterales bacterium]|nr:nitroreductase family protein [Acidiferrobacterales bacterium]